MNSARIIRFVGAVAAMVLGMALFASPAQAQVLERGFGASGGVSMFGHTCIPVPNNTVWVEVRGYPSGGNNHVNEVRYKNFSSATLLIHNSLVGANNQYTYFPSRQLSPFGEVVYPVNRTFPGKMTIVSDAVSMRDFGSELCGGTGGNRHAFSRP